MNSEKYSRGRRGAPAKGVGRATGARVQIPLSPLHFCKEFSEKNKQFKKLKKLVDNRQKRCYYSKALAGDNKNLKQDEKNRKKYLTYGFKYDNLLKLSRE